MKTLIIILILILFPILLPAQQRVAHHKSGEVAVRELPCFNSEVIARYSNFSFISSPEDECGYDGDSTNILYLKYLNDCKACGDSCRNWLFTEQGYVFHEEFFYIDDNEEFMSFDVDKDTVLLKKTNDLTIKITLIPFDASQYKIDYENGTIDDQYVHGKYLDMEHELKEIEVIAGNNSYKIFPTGFYTCRIKVYIGKHGDVYIVIAAGDASEYYAEIWAVVNGEFTDFTVKEAC